MNLICPGRTWSLDGKDCTLKFRLPDAPLRQLSIYLESESLVVDAEFGPRAEEGPPHRVRQAVELPAAIAPQNFFPRFQGHHLEVTLSTDPRVGEPTSV